MMHTRERNNWYSVYYISHSAIVSYRQCVWLVSLLNAYFVYLFLGHVSCILHARLGIGSEIEDMSQYNVEFHYNIMKLCNVHALNEISYTVHESFAIIISIHGEV